MEMKKNVSAYIITVSLLVTAVALVFALSMTGNLPFLKNYIPTPDTTDESGALESVSGTVSSIDNSTEPIEESEGSVAEVSDVDPVAEALASLENVNTDGYTVTDAMFDKTKGKLAVVKHYESLGEGVSMLPRMGFIFRTTADADGNKTITLLDEQGEVIFEELKYDFAGVRDALDHPLFREGKTYYYLDRTTLEFIETTYSEGENGRGIEFDYPSYYGRYQDGTTVRRSRSGLWGIYDSEKDEYIIYPYRSVVFTFNDNPVACAYDADSSRLTFYKLNTEVLNDKYYKPLTNGIENIGYYHFIDGLTRVRRIYNMNGERVSDEELMYTDGTLFNLPADFTLKAYSDGILLLARMDKFGYMSSNGTWITNPDYNTASPFIEGLAVVSKNGKYGMITTDGSVVVPLVFDSITNCSGGVIILYADGYGYYIVNKYMPPAGC